MTDTYVERQFGREPIHYIETRNASGVACYFLLRATRAQFTRLLSKKNRESLDLTEFGEIITSGYGTPTDKARADIKRRYNLTLPE